jgi:hypothetical protein
MGRMGREFYKAMTGSYPIHHEAEPVLMTETQKKVNREYKERWNEELKGDEIELYHRLPAYHPLSGKVFWRGTFFELQIWVIQKCQENLGYFEKKYPGDSSVRTALENLDNEKLSREESLDISNNIGCPEIKKPERDWDWKMRSYIEAVKSLFDSKKIDPNSSVFHIEQSGKSMVEFIEN